MVVKVYGEQEALKELRSLQKGVLKDKVYVRLRRGTDMVRGEVKRRAPIDTGRLRFSIEGKTFKDSLKGVVYADYPKNRKIHKTSTKKQAAGSADYYAMCIEYGTKNAAAQPFMAPGVRAKKKEVEQQLEMAMKEAVPDDRPAKA